MRQELTDAAIASYGAKATIAGIAFTGIGSFTSSLFFGYAGTLFAAVGLLITWYYKRRDDKRKEADDRRKEAEHQAIIKHLHNIRRSDD